MYDIFYVTFGFRTHFSAWFYHSTFQHHANMKREDRKTKKKNTLVHQMKNYYGFWTRIFMPEMQVWNNLTLSHLVCGLRFIKYVEEGGSEVDKKYFCRILYSIWIFLKKRLFLTTFSLNKIKTLQKHEKFQKPNSICQSSYSVFYFEVSHHLRGEFRFVLLLLLRRKLF